MECGLVGLPGSGKTTLFNALTGLNASGFSEKPNLGVANIPDPRLGVLAELIPPEKIIPATLKLVDIPGVPVGGASGGAKKLNAFLEHVRQVDIICQVVRCFDDGSGDAGINPTGDMENLVTELILADLVVAESAKDKAARHARSGDKDAKDRLALLEKVTPLLEEENAIRGYSGSDSGGASRGGWTKQESAILRSYGFITAKPVLFVANIAENDLEGSSTPAETVSQSAETVSSQALILCAQLEAELAELDPADRDEMLESLGLIEPAIGPLARALHAVLGLTTFYTAGDKEVRAWTISLGASAPEGAGVIHSDIQRGFIRAECYHVDDLVQFKTEKSIREAGKLRSEGKQYQLQDGDVVHFLFNV